MPIPDPRETDTKVEGTDAGLAAVEALRPDLDHYQPFHATRADLRRGQGATATPPMRSAPHRRSPTTPPSAGSSPNACASSRRAERARTSPEAQPAAAGRGQPWATVRCRMPRVARSAPSDSIGKMPASFHTGSMDDQS